MKRTFYELLDVPPDADRAQIDFAYVRATTELDADKNLRGTAAAAASRNLIREGYAIPPEHEQEVARQQHEQNQPVILKATLTDTPGGVAGADKRR